MVDSDREQRLKRMVVRIVAKTGDLQRQVADYQTLVSSLSERLDGVTAQLNDSQQQLRDSGIAHNA